MTPSDYEMIEQGYDPPRMTHPLEEENRRLRAELKAMEASRDQWANIAVQRGLELEDRAALAAEPASAEAKLQAEGYIPNFALRAAITLETIGVNSRANPKMAEIVEKDLRAVYDEGRQYSASRRR